MEVPQLSVEQRLDTLLTAVSAEQPAVFYLALFTSVSRPSFITKVFYDVARPGTLVTGAVAAAPAALYSQDPVYPHFGVTAVPKHEYTQLDEVLEDLRLRLASLPTASITSPALKWCIGHNAQFICILLNWWALVLSGRRYELWHFAAAALAVVVGPAYPLGFYIAIAAIIYVLFWQQHTEIKLIVLVVAGPLPLLNHTDASECGAL